MTIPKSLLLPFLSYMNENGFDLVDFTDSVLYFVDNRGTIANNKVSPVNRYAIIDEGVWGIIVRDFTEHKKQK